MVATEEKKKTSGEGPGSGLIIVRTVKLDGGRDNGASLGGAGILVNRI